MTNIKNNNVSSSNVKGTNVSSSNIGIDDVDGGVAPPPDLPPTAPTNFQVVAGTESATASWDAVVFVPAVTSYILNYKLESDVLWTSVNVGLNLSEVVLGLSRNELYDFRVRAVNSAGASPWTNIIQVTPLGVPLAPPTVSVVSGVQLLNVTWGAAPSTPSVTSYIVEYAEDDPTPSWTSVNVGLTLSHVITGLTPNQIYLVRVRGVNSEGNGDYSTIMQGIPTAVQPIKLVEYNNLGIVLGGNNTITRINNTGTGGSGYDLATIIGNGNNIQGNLQNGLRMTQLNSGVGLRPSSIPAPNIPAPYTIIWLGRSFNVQSSLVGYVRTNVGGYFVNNGGHSFITTGPDGQLGIGGEFNTNYHAIRVSTTEIKIDVYNEFNLVGSSVVGNTDAIDLELISYFWDFNQTNNQWYTGIMYESQIWDQSLTDSQMVGMFSDLAGKWGFQFPAQDFSSADFSPADFAIV